MAHCGNDQCRTSTGIHDGLTFGSGKLDDYGFWEHPCRICAEHWDQYQIQTREQLLQEYLLEHGFQIYFDCHQFTIKAKTHKQGIEYLKQQHQWLFEPAWPYSNESR